MSNDSILEPFDDEAEAWAQRIGWREQLDQIAELSASFAGRRISGPAGAELKMLILRQRNLIDRWVRQAFIEGMLVLLPDVPDLDQLKRLEADKARLDFLDSLNARLNARYGTTYRWEMVINHNVNRVFLGDVNRVDLNDARGHGLPSCRDAIDKEMRRLEGQRAARDVGDRAGAT